MKRLYVLRHAKSSWDDSSLADFERPLNDRGKEAAPFMGRVMRERGLMPDVVLSSPAKRAKKTAKLVMKSAGFAGEIEFDDNIYEASPQTLAKVLSGVDGKADSAMIIGHNPGMEGVIRFLTGESEPMATASLAVIDLDIDNWSDIGHETGKLVEVLRPKEIGHLT
jgi:phosphohistidine phosphatase